MEFLLKLFLNPHYCGGSWAQKGSHKAVVLLSLCISLPNPSFWVDASC